MNRDTALSLVAQKYEQVEALERAIDQIVASAAADWVSQHFPAAASIVFDEEYETGRLTLRRLADAKDSTIIERGLSPHPLDELENIVLELTDRAHQHVLIAEGYDRRALIVADYLPPTSEV